MKQCTVRETETDGITIMTELEEYYNKFNEEKRLNSRYGQVEFRTSMQYIHKYLDVVEAAGISKESIQILDIGAGTGRYSVALAEEGYSVTAVELVRYNLGILKKKGSSVRAMQGDARKLSKLEEEQFDITLLFGPLYHLFTFEDKLQALTEAKRVTKKGGVILTAYCMNEYGVITYAFKEGHIQECMEADRLTEAFHCVSREKDLYDYVRLEDIDALNLAAGLQRIQIISPDGPANYIRPTLNAMDDDTFELFMKYHLSTCERQDLIGAGAHTVDILRKPV